MRQILVYVMLFVCMNAQAEIAKLPLPNNGMFIANMPCSAQPVAINSAVGVTNALQCRADDGRSVCIFSIAEQPLDIQSFSKWKFKFIEEVHKQYATQMDANYRTISQRVTTVGGLGEVLIYELLRQQDGMVINVRGLWMVANNKMLRGVVSCAPNQTTFMKQEKELFLQSFSILNKQ